MATTEPSILDSATSTELIDELARRSHAIVIGMCPQHETEYTWAICTRGNAIIRQGLGRLLSAQLAAEAKEAVK